jgi:hypothetical protein
MSIGSSEGLVQRRASQRVRLIVFRALATLAGLFFLVPVVLMASVPWVLELLVLHHGRRR